jgi:hypothetical protein
MISGTLKQPRPQAQVVSIAAPVRGWNAKDALGDMDPLDAITLQNFWPGTNSVILRNGYTQHVTGITGQVETLMEYSGGSTSTLFGAAGSKIYDVTTAGAVGGASKSSMTNARFQYTNFTNAAGSTFLLAVNGQDKLIGWTGSAWYVDGDGSHDITGIDTAACSNIEVFKRRIWLIPNASLKAWYLPIDAISGAATALDMSSIAQLGGYIIAAMTWTMDAGYGIDDMLAFITNQGEVMIWRLTDPTAPTGISLIGVFQIGAPIGRRCYVKYAGDLLIITQDGLVPMSGAIQSSRLNPRVSITDQIQYAVSAAVDQYSSHFGWQILPYPKGNQLYLNVPIAEGSSQQQYVQNNITKAWCNFTNWAANCWELFRDDPYFGGNGFVGKAWNGTTDAGAAIPGFALQAFQTWGGAAQKQCKMIRFHLSSDGSPEIYGNVNVDYDLSDSSAQLSAGTGGTGALWDSALWDVGLWGSGLESQAFWQGATGIGYAFAPILKSSTNGIQLQWVSTDLMFERGGAL